ncbi:MAG TPA: rhodanese-like domain-containing protein, partial [Candidatus Limnocylindria bacterium]|nr:rhodanese-like domain-containing protein [Candidatus Limnocylindria bacterium]
MSRPRAPRDDDLLVDVAWLVAALAEPPPPSVLDVRWRLAGPAGVTDFDGGHIPGASYVDLETELAGPVRGDRVGGRHPLPAPEVFEAAMRRAGVRSGRTVVVVDDGDGPAAARAWWCLTYFGHSDVRILEGGWRAWVAAQGEVSSEVSGVEWGDFLAAPGGLAVLDALGTAEFLRRGGALLDARSGERFRGEVEPIDPVAGH